jgi:hypothetical protein
MSKYSKSPVNNVNAYIYYSQSGGVVGIANIGTVCNLNKSSR